jgi:hypothetical protein
MAARAAKKEGRDVREKSKLGFCQNLFMGSHRTPSRREMIAFEKRILRDPFSSLYGMCEQRAYYWFIVDLLRKAAVTVIYTFGDTQRMYILLVFFVLFAINHDIAQPYRGKTENLFAFITLMFIIILIHTATIVTGGSFLPMIMAATCVFGVFVIFFFSFIYAKKAAAEELAAEERIKRKAQDLWGEIASKVLGMEPSQSTEEDMKAAFAVFDAQTGNASSEEEEEEDSDSDGEGEIDIKELIAFTDDERKLHGVTPLYGFQADRDEIDAMAMEADLDGEGKIDYDEFVAVIFSSWERKQQTDNLKKWLYRNYKRTGDQERGVNTKHKKIGMHAKYLEAHPILKSNALVKDLLMFNGLVDSLGELSSKMDENNHHLKGKTPRRFKLDLKGIMALGLAEAFPQFKDVVNEDGSVDVNEDGTPRKVHDFKTELTALVVAMHNDGDGLQSKPKSELESELDFRARLEADTHGSVETFIHLIEQGAVNPLKIGEAFHLPAVLEMMRDAKARERCEAAQADFEEALGGEWRALWDIEQTENGAAHTGEGHGATVGDLRRETIKKRELELRERVSLRGSLNSPKKPGEDFEGGASLHMRADTETETEDDDDEEQLLQEPKPGQSKEELSAQSKEELKEELEAIRGLDPEDVPERP